MPLYDAIGYTVLQLFRKINRQEAKGNVTIITDGYENAFSQVEVATRPRAH